tara:strand:+ start:225 stop:470 length:246 start_codon:yes stop_codon:yes gene_type:complete
MINPNAVCVRIIQCFNDFSGLSGIDPLSRIDSDRFIIIISTVLGLVRNSVLVEQDWVFKQQIIINQILAFGLIIEKLRLGK